MIKYSKRTSWAEGFHHRLHFSLGRLRVGFECPSFRDYPRLGAFGGGWKTKLSMLIGTREVVFELLIISIRICVKRKEHNEQSN